jgi:hypothetical protein
MMPQNCKSISGKRERERYSLTHRSFCWVQVRLSKPLATSSLFQALGVDGRRAERRHRWNEVGIVWQRRLFRKAHEINCDSS